MKTKLRGAWLYLWPSGPWGWDDFEPGLIALALARLLGIAGVIMHGGLYGPQWCTAARVAGFNRAGLGVIVGLGFRGPARWEQVADAIIAGIDCCKRPDSPAVAVECDWESAWEYARAEASKLVARVVAKHPDAALYLLDVPWWAPLYTVDSSGVRHPTHPSAPTREFGVIMGPTLGRFVQAYGSPKVGRSAQMLAWSRNPSQYPSLGSWEILPTQQAYGRSVYDLLNTMLLAEPAVLVWNFAEMERDSGFALEIASFLAGKGHTGPRAVEAFQRAQGLKADNLWGPKTNAAAGLDAPPGVRWFGDGRFETTSWATWRGLRP